MAACSSCFVNIGILVFVHFFMVSLICCLIFAHVQLSVTILLFPHRGFLRLHRVSLRRRD